jgi:hypothetical protein
MIGGPYSFILFEAALALIAGLILLTRKPKWNDYLAWSVILAGLTIAFVALHPRATPLMEDARAIQESIGKGTPVLLEFQSPY